MVFPSSTSIFQQALARIASPRERLKLHMGKLFFHQQTMRWLHFVSQHPVLWGMTSDFPKLLTKIYRPYASQHWNCADRVDSLIEHYRLMEELGLSSLLLAASNNELLLVNALSHADATMRVELSVIRHGHREGEVGLHLSFRSVAVYSLTFSFFGRGACNGMRVAKIQGAAHANTRDLIREVTKACFGARPHSILLAIAQELAHCLGCTEVVLVGNQNRVALNPMRRRRIAANYNALWREMGATPMAGGDFRLSSDRPIEPDILFVPSKKRAQCRRKHELLADIRQQARSFLEAYRPAPLEYQTDMARIAA